MITNGAFGLYFVLTSCVYLFLRIPAFTFAVTLGCLTALTLLYIGNTRIKLLTVFITIIGFVVIETMTGFALNGLVANIRISDRFIDYATLSFVFTSILFMFFARLITRFSDIGRTDKIDSFEWFNLVLIPFFSIALILLVISSNVETNRVIIISMLILILDFSLFFLFDRLSKYYREQEEIEALNIQKRMYVNQLKYMNEHMDKVQKINHDFNKHIVSITEMINEGKNEKAANYMNNMVGRMEKGYNWSRSGNITVDSLVNHYLNSLDPEITKIKSLVDIDKELGINDVDITIILGNLLENAVKAIKDVGGKTKLYFNMEIEKGVVFISVENSFKGDLSMDRAGLPENSTRKSYGMKNILNTVEKYNGLMKVDYGNNLFSVDILLYQDNFQEYKEIG
jgi:signal transduction histidine kinase